MAERKIGLVAPLPPQVGGVASFAEWLLAHEEELGCRFETFDLWRPADGGVGGRLTPAAVVTQARLAPRFVRWARRAPRVVHYCVSGTATGLARDLACISFLRAGGHRVIAHIQVVPEENRVEGALLRALDRSVACWVGIAPRSVELLARHGVEGTWVANPIRLEANGHIPAPHSGALRLLFVGRYGERKGCPELVEALGAARRAGTDATLRFVGSEEHPGEEATLREAVSSTDLDGAVEFAGVLDRKELAEAYAAADVICLPSRREGMPLALLEGMAFGLPALATPVGGIPDFVVSGENGLLVPPGDVSALAESIRALADPALRAQLGVEARERVRRAAGSEAIVGRWRDIYTGVGG
ncbi:MAG: glycosyltransferase family 4 protein [Gaiellaceae bacterium]